MVKYLEWEPATYSRRAVPRSAARSAPLMAPARAPSVSPEKVKRCPRAGFLSFNTPCRVDASTAISVGWAAVFLDRNPVRAALYQAEADIPTIGRLRWIAPVDP